MDINKYLKTIEDINILIESISTQDIQDVQYSIDKTKEKMDMLNARIQSRLDQQNTQKSLPFTEISISFIDKIKLSLRAAVEKLEFEFYGRNRFNVLSVTDSYIILQKDDWDYRVGLILNYRTLRTSLSQEGDIQLFYSQDGFVSSAVKTRSSLKEKVSFEIIEKR
jgi:hypothetical protein